MAKDEEELVEFTGLNPDQNGVYEEVVQGFSVRWSKTSDEVKLTHPDGRVLCLTHEEAKSLGYMLSKDL